MAFPRNAFHKVAFLCNHTTLNVFLVRSQLNCLCPVVIPYRGKAKRSSKFPKEDGVTRIEELAKKFNPPPSNKEQEDLPNDSGFKLDSTGEIFSSYVPVENKAFILSIKGLGQRWEALKAFVMTTYAIAMIKRKAKPFKAVDFAKTAQKKFIDVNNAIQQENAELAKIAMKDHATLMVIKGLSNQFLNPSRKVHWRFIQEIERPRVVHGRITAVYDKDNLYAQITVRMHTEQILAVKDRYNRVIKGDPQKSKKVIDYVVFERHLADPYGKWRVCGKLFV
ncbi:39S ribosomal protein L45, mitochondrial-like [Hydractinia symbiolongicarpus]|uniref:39S ribosomal protein L45, mitochondrial-like n=1 Tax=Hydractinia symbiolongicarpus TaxID=13093 RepID=UPI00254B80B0|nr:39S ribosomal protein L45, mitochondrial-like [Hydractinia symbiolongicarpus]